MGDVINLRLVRKQRERVKASVRADRNRRLFGRTAAEKAADAAAKARTDKTLDGARLDGAATDAPTD